MSTKLTYVVIGFLMLVSLYFFYKGFQGEPEMYVPTETAALVSTSPLTGFTDEQIQKAALLERRTLRSKGDSVKLNLSLNVITRCGWGDMDILELELGHSSTKEVLVSIESPISSSRYLPVTTTATLSDIRRGFRKELSVPVPAEPTPLAIYICKDSTGSKRCNDKEKLDPNLIYNTYLHMRSDKAATQSFYRATDKVYYFQFLYFEGPGSVTYYKKVPKQDRPYALTLGYLNLKHNDPSGNEATVQEVRNLTSKIRSEPLEGKGNHLSLILPKRNLMLCKK